MKYVNYRNSNGTSLISETVQCV